jgi:hypothetical protein
MRSPLAFWKQLTGTRTVNRCVFPDARLPAAHYYLLYNDEDRAGFSVHYRDRPSQLPYLLCAYSGMHGGNFCDISRALKRIGLYSLFNSRHFMAVVSLLLFWWLVAYQWRGLPLHPLCVGQPVWCNHGVTGLVTGEPRVRCKGSAPSFCMDRSGRVVGGIVGGSLARIVAPWLGTEVLLPICFRSDDRDSNDSPWPGP